MAADRLETQIMALYDRIQLPANWLQILETEMAAEAEVRQQRDSSQRQLLTRQLTTAENQRRKLLDAYYNSAIDVATLKTEQTRIGRDLTAATNDLAALDANQSEWQQILTLAGQIATKCATAYRKADEPTRRLFNTAVFETITIKDGQIATATHRAPFDQLFKGTKFEYENLVVLRRWLSNPSSPLERALRAYRKLDLSQVTPHVSRPVVKRAKWLNPTELTQMVTGYRAGATVYELADQFGVNRNTIAKHLKAQGVRLRLSSLTGDELARAIELYAIGLSTAKVGAQLGRDHSTIWQALRGAGVQLRDSHGRDAQAAS